MVPAREMKAEWADKDPMEILHPSMAVLRDLECMNKVAEQATMARDNTVSKATSRAIRIIPDLLKADTHKVMKAAAVIINPTREIKACIQAVTKVGQIKIRTGVNGVKATAADHIPVVMHMGTADREVQDMEAATETTATVNAADILQEATVATAATAVTEIQKTHVIQVEAAEATVIMTAAAMEAAEEEAIVMDAAAASMNMMTIPSMENHKEAMDTVMKVETIVNHVTGAAGTGQVMAAAALTGK